MEKRTWVKLIVTMLVVGGIVACAYRQWYWGSQSGGGRVVWGRGRPSLAERSYYINRMDKIIENWRNARSSAERGVNGRFRDSYNTLLVIDTDENAFWIEEDGKIQPENHTALTPNMKWTLHRTSPQGSKKLSGRTKLKLRGYNRGQELGEHFYLVGTRGGSGYIQCNFGSSGGGSGWGAGSHTIPAFSSSKETTKDIYPSLILTEGEYEEYLKKAASADPNGLDGQNAGEESLFAKNKASWPKVEKLLYQQIEHEILAAGYSLKRIEVEPGPDYSAAHAHIYVHEESFLREIVGEADWGEIYIEMDFLGDEIWYGAEGDDPQQPNMSRRRVGIDVEFLMCSTGDIADHKRGELLEKGRKIQNSLPAPPLSKWKVKLANGAIVQFMGICDYPFSGKKWWGPDGTSTDYAPYAALDVYGRSRENRRIYAMIWKVEYPYMSGPNKGGYWNGNIEGFGYSYEGAIYDRYGGKISGSGAISVSLRIEGRSFEKSCKKTTLKLNVRVGKGEFERVEFKNISLVRGEDQGFEIYLDKKE